MIEKTAESTETIAKGEIPKELLKPGGEVRLASPKAANLDPMSSMWLTAQSMFPSDIHQGTGILSYTTLRAMSRIPYIAAILLTRMNQASDFAVPQPDPYSIGHVITPDDKKRALTRKDRKTIAEIEDVILNAGREYFPGGFESFLRAIVHDTLVYDQVNVEKVMNHTTGKPRAFVPADPTTLRRKAPDRSQIKDMRWDIRDTGYIQVLNNRIVNEFTPDQMSWWIRNRETFMYRNGYGAPELEKAVSIVAALVNAITHNTVNYTTGIHSQNLIEAGIIGSDDRMSTLQRVIEVSTSGIRHSRRTPLFQVNPALQEYLKVHPLGSTNKEMEFSEWINFLKKQLCSLFQMDPAELGDIFGTENQKTQVGSSSPTDRIIASKERGLRPLMRTIQRWINEFIIEPHWPGYRMSFRGFDSVTEEKKIELDLKAVATFLSPNELRIERGLEPWDDPVSKRPLNALYTAYIQNELVKEQAPIEDDVETLIGR